MANVTKLCLICKVEFKTSKYIISIGKGKYCSKGCHIHSQIGVPSNNKGKKLPLETIQKMKESKKINKKIGKDSHLWKGGKAKCLDCTKTLSTYTNKMCYTCAGIAKSGVNSYNWISDRTKLKDDSMERGGQLHRQWSIDIKTRDKWKCRIADNNCDGNLQAHHILGWSEHPELRYNINNGITLCHAHHPRKRAEEKRLVPTFTELVLTPVLN